MLYGFSGAEGGPGISQHSVQYVNDSIFPLKVMNCLRAKLCFFPVEGEDNLNITKKKKRSVENCFTSTSCCSTAVEKGIFGIIGANIPA